MKHKVLGVIILTLWLCTACGEQEIYSASVEPIETMEQMEETLEDATNTKEFSDTEESSDTQDYAQLLFESYEDDLEVLSGADYGVDLLIYLEGYYSFISIPEEQNLKPENCQLSFLYDTYRKEEYIDCYREFIDVQLTSGSQSYVIGSVYKETNTDAHSGEVPKDIFFSPDASFSIFPIGEDDGKIDLVLVRNYDADNHTIELCFVDGEENDMGTAFVPVIIDDTWTTYEIDSSARFFGYAWDYNGIAGMDEQTFMETKVQNLQESELFCDCRIEEGKIMELWEILNP